MEYTPNITTFYQKKSENLVLREDPGLQYLIETLLSNFKSEIFTQDYNPVNIYAGKPGDKGIIIDGIVIIPPKKGPGKDDGSIEDDEGDPAWDIDPTKFPPHEIPNPTIERVPLQ